MSTTGQRVCVIGAGPAGMSVLYQFGQIESDAIPELVCYEKQDTWGGLWNYTWRTGTDGFGELCHGGMYKHLWSNNPKEVVELPDYTFEEHFGNIMPSFVPRQVIRDYLEGRWTKKSKTDLKRFIKFNHAVRHIKYNKLTDNFIATVHDLVADTTREETFTHVIVTVGIFNSPNVPEFPGFDNFEGRVIHSHNFRNAREYKGQRVLVIGASYSADDIAVQCLKFGAKQIVCTWRTKPMGLKWPEGIEERPLLQKLVGNVATFRDGSTAEIYAVILCIGYRYSFPFMEEELRLKSDCTIYPHTADNLYKGTLWVKGGNNNVFYIVTQNQLYSFTMFDVQALWTCRYIMGNLDNEPQKADKMTGDIATWIKRCTSVKDTHDAANFQTAFVSDLCERAGYTRDILKNNTLLHAWITHRLDDIKTFRNHRVVSNYTGKKTPQPSPWMEAFDDRIDVFINA